MSVSQVLGALKKPLETWTPPKTSDQSWEIKCVHLQFKTLDGLKKIVSGSIKQLYVIRIYGKLLDNIYFILFYIGKSVQK